MKQLIANLFDILFPPICAGCGGDSEHRQILCAVCQKSLIPHPLLQCSVCRGRVPFAASKSERCHPSASHLIFSAGEYSDALLRRLIWQCKFKRRQVVARILADLLAEALRDTGYDSVSTIFVPIPLSKKRMRERGFNQAEKIAHFLSLKTHNPVIQCLVRTKETAAQSEISDYEQRRVNMAHAFAVTERRRSCVGKRVAIIDDVWTSGATMSEAALTLKEAGVVEVVALVVARAH